MSRSRRRKPRRVKVTCTSCRKDLPGTPAALLSAAAGALNACRDAGLDLKIRHGAVQCEQGLLLPLSDGSYVARTRLYTPFSVPEGDDLDS